MKPRRRQAKPLKGIDPLIAWVATFAAGERVNRRDLEKKSGVTARTICGWVSEGNDPKLSNLRAVIGALGYELKLERRS